MNPIETFVKIYEKRSINTVKNYRSILKQYFNVIKKDPENYFTTKDQDAFKHDIEFYYDSISARPPKTRDTRLFCLKSFFLRNSIDIPSLFFKQLRESIKERGAISEDRVPKTEELKRILSHATIRERSWVLLALSSGMRIGEIIAITKDDLHLNEKTPYVLIPGNITKSGERRFTFLTNEAKESVLEWLEVRDEYLRKLTGKNNLIQAKPTTRYHNPKDTRVFPFSYCVMQRAWNTLLKKTHLDQEDKRTERKHLHVHVLRKFAKTRMLMSMREPMVNSIIGHSSYLSREYQKFDISQIAPEYEKAIPNLLIFETTPDLTEMNQELSDLKKDFRKVMEKWLIVKDDNERLEREIEKIKK